jgi:hypothetical protein
VRKWVNKEEEVNGDLWRYGARYGVADTGR